MTPDEIHRHLKGVYSDDAIDRSTINRSIVKLIWVVHREKHRKFIDDLTT